MHRARRQPPEEDELPLADRSSEEVRALNDAAWQAFWGWDCCGPDGLLERVYKCAIRLGIPQLICFHIIVECEPGCRLSPSPGSACRTGY